MKYIMCTLTISITVFETEWYTRVCLLVCENFDDVYSFFFVSYLWNLSDVVQKTGTWQEATANKKRIIKIGKTDKKL